LGAGKGVARAGGGGPGPHVKGSPPDPALPPGFRAARVHGGEPPRRLERSPRRARARAGDFGLAADRSASPRWSSADSRVGLLVARRALRNRGRLRLAKLGEPVADGLVREREDRGREQRRVLG